MKKQEIQFHLERINKEIALTANIRKTSKEERRSERLKVLEEERTRLVNALKEAEFKDKTRDVAIASMDRRSKINHKAWMASRSKRVSFRPSRNIRKTADRTEHYYLGIKKPANV